jgi:hypothetical protein
VRWRAVRRRAARRAHRIVEPPRLQAFCKHRGSARVPLCSASLQRLEQISHGTCITAECGGTETLKGFKTLIHSGERLSSGRTVVLKPSGSRDARSGRARAALPPQARAPCRGHSSRVPQRRHLDRTRRTEAPWRTASRLSSARATAVSSVTSPSTTSKPRARPSGSSIRDRPRERGAGHTQPRALCRTSNRRPRPALASPPHPLRPGEPHAAESEREGNL